MGQLRSREGTWLTEVLERRRSWPQQPASQRGPLHFSVFSKSCPLSPSWVPPSCHVRPFPVIPRTGEGLGGGTLGPITSSVAHVVSSPRSLWKLQACQSPALPVSHSGVGSPASRLEIHPLTPEVNCLSWTRQGVDAVLETRRGLLDSSPTGPELHSLSPPPIRRQVPPSECMLHPRRHLSFPALGSFLSLCFMKVVAFVMDCPFNHPTPHPCRQGMETCHL